MESWYTPSPDFEPFGTSHLIALALSGVILVVMIGVARSQKSGLGHGSRPERFQSWMMAIILLICWPANLIHKQMTGGDWSLPMNLCNWAAAAGALALIFKWRLATEMVYFWGLAGTLNGLITPDLGYDFPDPRFFNFFALHSGVVVTALYVVVGLKLYPRQHAIWRMFAWTQVYLISALGANFVADRFDWLEGNYAFLMHKPLHADSPLLNALGPHPWYILGLEGVCLVLFALLYLPFLAINRKGTSRVDPLPHSSR